MCIRYMRVMIICPSCETEAQYTACGHVNDASRLMGKLETS